MCIDHYTGIKDSTPIQGHLIFFFHTLLKYTDDQRKIIVEGDREWRENWMDVQYIILLLLVL